jgi:hypothetical protein
MAAERSPTDGKLVVLGRQFESLATQIDHAIEDGTEIAWEVLHQLDGVEAEIVATPATTIDGLCVKARAACWALLGDLDPAGQSTTDKRMAFSILRDLIGRCAPSFERPGALTKLVEVLESGAGNSVTHETTGSIGTSAMPKPRSSPEAYAILARRLKTKPRG